MDDDRDAFTRLDDSALLSKRAEMRGELERLPPASPGHAALTALYDKSTAEVRPRAEGVVQGNRGATRMNDAVDVISALPPKAAKMVAVEILLADPESLADDVLESCLYVLRERLRAA